MKRTIALLAAFLLIFSVPAVFAQMPVGVPIVPAVSAGIERIGVVAAAQGQVQLTTPGQVGRIAQSGQPVFMGDLVNTDAKSHLQILLLDETVFTIGPNSAITIDRFVYDPKTREGEIKASVAKGVFRYVSGKIAVKNPNKVTVKLPTSTIGFRGTIVGGSVGADGQGLVGLLGPGDNNDSGAQTGSFTIEGAGGDHQDVNRTGFGVEVGAAGGLSDVFQFSDDQINGLTGGLGGGAQGGGGGGGDSGGGLGGDTDMGDLSGETGALTGENGALTDGLSGITDNLNDTSIKGAQDALDASGEAAPTGNTTTMAQLRDDTRTETYHYSGSGTYGAGANVYAQVEITFGSSGQIGTGNSYVLINQGERVDSTSAISDPQSFVGNGNAVFNWPAHAEAYGDFTVQVTLSNSGGEIAQQAQAVINYTNTESPYPTAGPDSGSATITGTLSPGALST